MLMEYKLVKTFYNANDSDINEWIIKNNAELIDIKRYTMKSYYDTGELYGNWIETQIIYRAMRKC